MSAERGFWIFVALCVAACVAYNIEVALHVVFVPSWPEGWCWVIAGAVTFAVMLFIVTGAGNVFYEGIVVWTICGCLLAFIASMPVSSKTRIDEMHRKYLQRQQMRLNQQKQSASSQSATHSR